MPVTDPSAMHATHDELTIVAYAAGDLHGAEFANATELVASCPACARLVDELSSIRAALASLPVPHRTRDFRLTEADAARLRPTGWRRLVVALASPRLAFTQPLAAGLATLGIAGLLLATIPSALPAGSSGVLSSVGAFVAGEAGSSSSASADQVAAPAGALPSAASGVVGGAPATAEPSAAPLTEPSAAAPVPAPSLEAGALTQSAPPAAPSAEPGSRNATSTEGSGTTEAAKSVPIPPSAAETGLSPLTLGSIVLLVAGAGLFLLRWTARRLTDA